jgi:hypothetical protein
MTPSRFDAIVALVGGGVSIGADPNGNVSYHDGQTPPSEADIQTKLVELKAEYDAQDYSRSRQAEYPSVQECVHAILDDTLDALQAKRASVKLKYPKGG